MPNGVLQNRITHRDTSHNQNNKFPKLKMGTAAILKIVLSLYPSHGYLILMNLVCRYKFWFQECSLDKRSKFWKFKMADGHHHQQFFGYFSLNYSLINANFGMMKQKHA